MIGVSTACLYPELTEESLLYLARNGVHTVEVFFNTFSEFELVYAQRLKEICLEYGVRILSVHPFTSFMETYFFFDQYARRRDDGLKLYRSFFETAAFLGAEIFNFHGQLQQGADIGKQYFEAYAELFSIAREYGLIFSQENVRNYKSRDISFIRRMSEYLGDNVRFTLDTKQAYMAGQDVFEMARTMSGKLALVHINDHNAESSCLLPGQGDSNLLGLHDSLSANGYTGAYMIEVYSSNYASRQQIIDSKILLEKLFERQA